MAGPPRYLVVPFENVAGRAAPLLAQRGVRNAVTEIPGHGASSIRREDRLRAFERMRVPPVGNLSHATVIRLGQVVGAAFVVLGRFEVEGDDLIVRMRTHSSRHRASLPAELTEKARSRHAERLQPVDRRIVPDSVAPGRAACASFARRIRTVSRDCSPKRRKPKSRFCRKRFDYPQRSIAQIALWEAHTDQGNHQEALAAVRQVLTAIR